MSEKKKSIAFIHPDLGIGGAERLVLDVANALKIQGHNVKFLANHFDQTHTFDELKSGEFTVDVYGDWLPRSIFGKCQALCAYIRMIYLILVYILFYRKSTEIDLYFIDLIPVAIPFLKVVNQKVVYYCHHPDLLASPPGGCLKKMYRMPIDWFEMKATGMADVILVNSEYTASVFRKTFPDIKKDIRILYPTIAQSYENTINNMKYKKNICELLPQLQCKDPIIFLSVNRFHPAKQIELAIKAFSLLKKNVGVEWDKIFLIIAGGYDPQSNINEETYKSLYDLASKENVIQKVIFMKSPSDEVKAQLLLSCTCLIYTPSKEHFGIVPLEAMFAAKPVIAINSGGPRETIDHGITGFLSDSTPDSLAEFMRRILTLRKDELNVMGTKGKQRLEERFSSNIFSKKLSSLIAEITDRRKLK